MTPFFSCTSSRPFDESITASDECVSLDRRWLQIWLYIHEIEAMDAQKLPEYSQHPRAHQDEGSRVATNRGTNPKHQFGNLLPGTVAIDPPPNTTYTYPTHALP